MKIWSTNLLGSGGRLSAIVTSSGESEWYSLSRQRNQTKSGNIGVDYGFNKMAPTFN